MMAAWSELSTGPEAICWSRTSAHGLRYLHGIAYLAERAPDIADPGVERHCNIVIQENGNDNTIA
jgi:hypothetical protein